MIRALVADDSGLMRLIISDILNADPVIKVIDTAVNGMEAVKKVLDLKPDVVVLDLNMGEYDGKYAVKKIMAEQPTPILILSALGNTDLNSVLEVLKLGAVDYINKPEKNATRVRDIAADIIKKVKVVSTQANKKALIRNKDCTTNTYEHTFPAKINYDVIVIGASTGGPTAVEKVITKLPKNLPVPVLIAQHMPSNFVPSFVERLNALSPLDIVMAKADDLIIPGKIYIAPGNENIKVARTLSGRVKIMADSAKYKEYNHPSVTGLMLSVAEVYKERSIGVILTGMGRDGAEGLAEIKKAGGYTVVQNKETSVVYGMPREAMEKGYARLAVSIDEMSGFLVSCLD